MDAVTSFELEAQRRRETVASDRWGAAQARTDVMVGPVETKVAERSAPGALPGRQTERIASSAECQPAPAAR